MSHEPTLPFESQTDDVIRGRLHKALGTVYIQEHIAKGAAQRPGQLRRHVFDFTDGVRMIASVEREKPATDKMLHLSFSMTPGSYNSFDTFLARVVNAVNELFPNRPIRQQFTTQYAVHFICDPPDK